MGQIELFNLSQIDDRDFYYGCHDHHTTAISTKHKRPKGKTIAPLPKTAIAIPAQTIHTI